MSASPNKLLQVRAQVFRPIVVETSPDLHCQCVPDLFCADLHDFSYGRTLGARSAGILIPNAAALLRTIAISSTATSSIGISFGFSPSKMRPASFPATTEEYCSPTPRHASPPRGNE